MLPSRRRGNESPRDFVRAAESAAGSIRILATSNFVLRLMGMVSPLMREITDMSYLFTDPVVLDETRLRSILPALVTTSDERGIAVTIATLRARRGNAHV